MKLISERAPIRKEGVNLVIHPSDSGHPTACKGSSDDHDRGTRPISGRIFERNIYSSSTDSGERTSKEKNLRAGSSPEGRLPDQGYTQELPREGGWSHSPWMIGMWKVLYYRPEKSGQRSLECTRRRCEKGDRAWLRNLPWLIKSRERKGGREI